MSDTETKTNITKAKPPLRLALIGMSGAGKTFWTRRIAETGVAAISCDDLIEEKLATRLKAGGFEGINGVAAGMGWAGLAEDAGKGAEDHGGEGDAVGGI